MIDLEINGENEYEDYFSNRYANRKVFVPASARMKSDMKFYRKEYSALNLCTTRKAA